MVSLLEVSSLSAGYEGIRALFDVHLSVSAGEIVALLGANGAGKTTTLLTINGLLRADGGSVTFEGESLLGLAPHVIARRGIALVPDDRALLPSLTVAENLALARSRVFDIRDLFPELARLSSRPAGLLSGGEQQMLAIARTISSAPKLLMIDELSLGLAPVLVARLLSRLRTVADELRMGILVVEQHVEQILRNADRGYVVARGRIVAEESAASLLDQRALLKESYLGAPIKNGTVS